MGNATLLLITLFLPLAGAAALLLVPPQRDTVVRRLTLAVMLAQLALAAMLYQRFDAAATGLQFATHVPWIAAWGVGFSIGLDGYNVLLVLLTAFLGPLAVAGSLTAIRRDVKLFHVILLFTQFAITGAFVAQDLFLFYVFWEAMVIPMFFLIGIWGGARRREATIKFVLYTAFGSILMLAAIIYLALSLTATSDVVSFAIADLLRAKLPLSAQVWLLAAFGLAFAIKVPLVPLHTWLPDAYTEAPIAGSLLLSGVLAKVGTYGFMKLALPLFPDAAVLYAPFIGTLAVISILYGACLALVQQDIKRVVAYSSVSHLGFVILGLASLDLIGIQGAVIQMVSHGLVAAGLFLLVGMLEERGRTREIAAYGGIAKLMPVYSVLLLVLTLAAIGLPTTSGFTGEFLVLLGAFGGAWARYANGAVWPLVASVAAVSGVVLGALYMLWLVQRVLFGAARAPFQPLADLGARERAIVGVIVVAVFALGLFPGGPLAKTELAARDFQRLVTTSRAGRAVAGTPAPRSADTVASATNPSKSSR
jgi:NADH-quinone oxidoreductase subunit M